MSSYDRNIGVALVDGTPLVREGLSALVHRTPGMRWVGAAESAALGQRLCERLRPAVVLVDSGLDPRGHLVQALTAGNREIGVVLLVDDAHRTARYLTGAFTAGVRGALRRTAQPPEVLRAIQAVHLDGRYLDPTLAPALALPGPPPTRQPRQALSRREHQVLQLIADGLENQAIADLLFVSVETVRTHVKSILRKLASRDRTHAVAVAFRSGVLVVDEQPVPDSRSARD
ncbi:MAG TPA: response regulator transcription factor [Actinophytocola sp.]|nr:response regulator transcription factor [Actinophytocola sp.]